jgi:hypothetical protein
MLWKLRHKHIISLCGVAMAPRKGYLLMVRGADPRTCPLRSPFPHPLLHALPVNLARGIMKRQTHALGAWGTWRVTGTQHTQIHGDSSFVRVFRAPPHTPKKCRPACPPPWCRSMQRGVLCTSGSRRRSGAPTSEPSPGTTTAAGCCARWPARCTTCTGRAGGAGRLLGAPGCFLLTPGRLKGHAWEGVLVLLSRLGGRAEARGQAGGPRGWGALAAARARWHGTAAPLKLAGALMLPQQRALPSWVEWAACCTWQAHCTSTRRRVPTRERVTWRQGARLLRLALPPAPTLLAPPLPPLQHKLHALRPEEPQRAALQGPSSQGGRRGPRQDDHLHSPLSLRKRLWRHLCLREWPGRRQRPPGLPLPMLLANLGPVRAARRLAVARDGRQGRGVAWAWRRSVRLRRVLLLCFHPSTRGHFQLGALGGRRSSRQARAGPLSVTPASFGEALHSPKRSSRIGWCAACRWHPSCWRGSPALTAWMSLPLASCFTSFAQVRARFHISWAFLQPRAAAHGSGSWPGLLAARCRPPWPVCHECHATRLLSYACRGVPQTRAAV